MFKFEDVTGINESWDDFLTAFREDVYPVFEKHGFTFSEAVMIYKLNKIDNEICDATTPPEEDWKLSN